MQDRVEPAVEENKKVWETPSVTRLVAGAAEGFGGPPNNDGGTFLQNPS